jgi:hypothetical protein
MIVTDSDENHFYKDIEINYVSEDESSCRGKRILIRKFYLFFFLISRFYIKFK